MFLCFIAIACTCIYTTFQTGVFLSAVRLCAYNFFNFFRAVMTKSTALQYTRCIIMTV